MSSSRVAAFGKKNGKKRTLSEYDSDESEDENGPVLITGFDAKGAKLKHLTKKTGPLVIPAMPNRDWQEAAAALRGKKSKKGIYVPEEARARSEAVTAAGAGVDAINTEPVRGGLERKKRREEEPFEATVVFEQEEMHVTSEKKKKEETQTKSEEQKALEALLRSQDNTEERISIADIAPAEAGRNNRFSSKQEMSETEAFRYDVETRPEAPSLDDYERVPVGQFGAALLRGMGWKEGTPATRGTRASAANAPTEAYVPKSRPAFLGIGAKPMTPSDGKAPSRRYADSKFVPLVKRADVSKNRSESATESDVDRRRIEDGSRQGRESRYEKDDRRERGGESDTRRGESDRDGKRDSDRRRDHDDKSRDYERARDYDKTRRDYDKGERGYPPEERYRRDDRDRYGRSERDRYRSRGDDIYRKEENDYRNTKRDSDRYRRP